MKRDGDPTDPRDGHERRDIEPAAVALFAAGLVAHALVTILLIGWLFWYFHARVARLDLPASPLAGEKALPPEPRLQVDPAEDLRKMRLEENAVLNGYGWIDRRAGIARIPIERAMELMSERKLGSRSPAGGKQ